MKLVLSLVFAAAPHSHAVGVLEARDGCGRDYHRDRWGHCRRDYERGYRDRDYRDRDRDYRDRDRGDRDRGDRDRRDRNRD